MNDIMFWSLLLIMIHFGLLARVANIETAFLYGKLKEEIYMECMKDIGNDDCVMLGKSIYSLVQAARQYTKVFTKLKKVEFIGGNVVLWLYMKKHAKGIAYVVYM